MRNLFLVLTVVLGLLSTQCQSSGKKTNELAETSLEPIEKEVVPQQTLDSLETAYFASGCFWCVEAIFESVKGVKEVYSGYSGGEEKNPTYEDVAYGRTGHAEAVEVYYNPEVINFQQLVQVFFGSHDPTALNRQGPDRGYQYRSVAFYKDASEKKIIDDYIALLTEKQVYDRPIVTQVSPFEKFYIAEEYHQDFERRNPNNPYIKNVSIPRLKRFKANFGSYLKDNLAH